MPTYVVDASVLVSDAQPYEVAHPEAFALLHRISGEKWPIYLPTIALAEVGASIVRNTGQASLAQRVLARYQTSRHIELVAIDATLGRLAAQIGVQQRIRGCDAIYVALAQVMNATLITLDTEQRQRAPSSVVARTPVEELAALNS
jgi:predicted nucleic acid-binding protein